MQFPAPTSDNLLGRFLEMEETFALWAEDIFVVNLNGRYAILPTYKFSNAIILSWQSCREDGEVQVWEAETGKLISSISVGTKVTNCKNII